MRQKLLKKNKKFNFTLHYINDVLSLNNFKFGDLIPTELEIKDTTERARSVSYFDSDIEIESEGRLRTKHYDKGDY
jgi:hypothetical protein